MGDSGGGAAAAAAAGQGAATAPADVEPKGGGQTAPDGSDGGSSAAAPPRVRICSTGRRAAQSKKGGFVKSLTGVEQVGSLCAALLWRRRRGPSVAPVRGPSTTGAVAVLFGLANSVPSGSLPLIYLPDVNRLSTEMLDAVDGVAQRRDGGGGGRRPFAAACRCAPS
ncbi:hypothetical protein PLESTB_000343200 [Pleodorina starrii]|uniref:Uncharacterized protein n=1 Tax=Pleodorina starrii TaxID=330485 RepID=A0A9W6BDF1_9CHLO|nr:hypothetical protein PLESTB_000343200 [Pleodorina starrii]